MAHPGILSVLTKRIFQFFHIYKNLKVTNCFKKGIIYVYKILKENNYLMVLSIALKMKYIRIMV